MERKQRGITLIGFVMVLIVVGCVAFLAMNLAPVYQEYFAVMSSMKSVAAQPGASSQDLTTLQRSLQKSFDVGYVDSVSAKTLKVIHDKSGNTINMNYEV